MASYDLDPGYTAGEIPGKCIRCLAEQELSSCLRALLRGEGEDKELQEQYEMLVSFLESPESRQLRDEAERLLAEGKKVTLRLSRAVTNCTSGAEQYRPFDGDRVSLIQVVL